MNSSALEPRQPQDPVSARTVPSLVPGISHVKPESEIPDTFDLWFAMDFRNILRRRWRVVVIPVILLVGAALGYSAWKQPVYESDATVLLQWQQDQSGIGSMLGGSGGGLSSILGDSGGNGADIPTQSEVMLGDTILSKVIKQLNLPLTPDKLRKEITIEPDKLSGNIMDITVKDPSALHSKQIAEYLVSDYKQEMGNEDSTVIGQSEGLVREQIRTTEKELDLAEDRMSAYSKRSGSIAPDIESQKRVEAMYDLQTSLLDAQQKVGAERAAQQYYASQMATMPTAIVPTLTLEQNPRIQDYKTQLIDLQAQRASLAKYYTPNDDEMVQNQFKINQVKQQMVDEIKAQSDDTTLPDSTGSSLTGKRSPQFIISNATKEINPIREDLRAKVIAAKADQEADQANIDAIQAAISSSKKDFVTAPSKMRVMADLKDDVDVKRKIYDALQAQLATLKSTQGTDQIYVHTLTPPELAKYPAAPKPLLYSLLAALAGLLLGIGTMLGMESADKRFRSPQDIVHDLGLPVLAILPRLGHTKSGATGRVFEGPQQTNDFKRLASSLAYMGLGKSFHSLLLTSAVPGEGVTFTASQLALELSNQGRRVILVDANLRNPALHTYFGLVNAAGGGFAGAMRNGAHPENALVPYQGKSALQLIPGGDLESSTSGELLNPEKLTTLLSELRDRADIVLLDAPSILDGMDTATLADKVDAVVMVTSGAFAQRDEVRRAVALVSSCKAPVIGTIFNESGKPKAGK